jgi:hypothetical protein
LPVSVDGICPSGSGFETYDQDVWMREKPLFWRRAVVRHYHKSVPRWHSPRP